ncbi:DNA primase [Alkaliphilus sp. B6464]|uniref:DNA primase n=1 Tax=Alkaliphilus sp. B6464 TaxID=2731219 RepID=UPI001BA97D9E|nr:toprim domain-containing protein [Alkaliphilus sp. B6464]QUH21928.1 toprim domain-containing protein [Alkaliphilus sp. B6464]
MIDIFKGEINKNICNMFKFEEVRGLKHTLLRTNCIKDNSHYMYFKDNKFSCPVCGFNQDLVSLCADMSNTDEWIMTERIFKGKLKRNPLEVIKARRNKEYENEIYRLINYETMLFFKEQLKENQEAINYLLNRGLTSEIIDKFELGYAPKFNKLLRYLSKDFSEEDLLTAGVIGQDEKTGRYYDMFKDRIMFPIYNLDGSDIISFGGRTLGSSPKKYINTRNTPLFKKSNNLYALNMINFKKINTNGKLKKIIVSEGYMDVIAMHQAGIDYAIGTLGTALTSIHYKILQEIAEQVIIIYDGDDAGIRAVERTLEKVGNLDILILPEGLDPDEYIKKYGIDNFLEYLNINTRSSVDYWMNQYNNYRGNVFEYLLKHVKNL